MQDVQDVVEDGHCDCTKADGMNTNNETDQQIEKLDHEHRDGSK